jgi:hypothetical protein
LKLTVSDLIQILKKFPQDNKVVGNNYFDVEIKQSKDKVIIYEDGSSFDDEMDNFSSTERFSSSEETLIDDSLDLDDYGDY